MASVQVKEAIPSTQVSPLGQGLGMQSLISEKKQKTFYLNTAEHFEFVVSFSMQKDYAWEQEITNKS